MVNSRALAFVRYMEKFSVELPKDVEGLALALVLRDNPLKFFWKGETCFTYDPVNEKFLYCNPFNEKRFWWYSANGLQGSYARYEKPVVRVIRKDNCETCFYKQEFLREVDRLNKEGVLPF